MNKLDIWICTKCYDVIKDSFCVECSLPAWTLGETIKYIMEHAAWLQDRAHSSNG